jgi:hypothetical protein
MSNWQKSGFPNPLFLRLFFSKNSTLNGQELSDRYRLTLTHFKL